jgi:hypothetical protein
MEMTLKVNPDNVDDLHALHALSNRLLGNGQIAAPAPQYAQLSAPVAPAAPAPQYAPQPQQFSGTALQAPAALSAPVATATLESVMASFTQLNSAGRLLPAEAIAWLAEVKPGAQSIMALSPEELGKFAAKLQARAEGRA